MAKVTFLARWANLAVINAVRGHNLPSFLLGITNLHRKSGSSSDFNVNLGGFLFTQDRTGSAECNWVVLPSESPIRTSLQHLNSEYLIDPQLSTDWIVKRSSLITEAVVTTTPVQISDRVWYSHPDGLALLKSIYKRFTTGFSPCEMNRTEDEQIYFTFDREGETWRVELPNDFPKSPCAIYPTQTTSRRSYLESGAGTELLATVEDFFANYDREMN